jgi:hypothetical protein
MAAFGGVLALLQPVCPAKATPPPGPDFQETPIEQPEQAPQAPASPSNGPQPAAGSGPVTGAAPAAGNEAAPAASNGAEPAAGSGPDFIEQPIEQAAGAPAPASPTPSGGPFAFLNNMDRNAALFGDLWGVRPMLARYGMTLTIADTEGSSAM